jgi:lipopolysaccharide transport system permease protein
MLKSLKDFLFATGYFREISFLGVLDVKQRYRRSTLGPFWITIATSVNIAGLAIVFGAVFQVPYAEYVPFLCCGLVIWSFLTTSFTEASDLLVEQREQILERRVSLYELVGRLAMRNVYISLHNFIVLFVVLLIFVEIHIFNIILSAVGFCLLSCFIFFSSVSISIIGARFRDLTPIVTSLLQMGFYVTPIVWSPEIMVERGRAIIVNVNPFYHFIEIIRSPLLGSSVLYSSYIFVLVVTIVSACSAFLLVDKYQNRVSYWV